MNSAHANLRWVQITLFVFLLATTRLVAAQTVAEPPSTPSAQPELVRQATFNKAYALLQEGEAARAVALFEQLQRQRPEVSVDYALGMAYAANHQPGAAAASLERFLRGAAGANVPPEVLAEAQRRFADYQRQLSRLGVAFVMPPTAQPVALQLNGQFIAELPGGVLQPPLWLTPGPYQVMVSAPGTRPYQTNLDLRPGELRELTGTLDTDPLLVPLVPSSGPTRWNSVKAKSTARKVLIGVGVTIGTLVVAGVVTFVVLAAAADGSTSSPHHHHDFD